MKTAERLKGASTKRRIAGSQPGAQHLAGRRRTDVDDSGYSGRIALRIRELREAKGLTVEQLAEKIGISWQALYAYEARTRKLPPDLYPTIARALGCKLPNDFFPPLK